MALLHLLNFWFHIEEISQPALSVMLSTLLTQSEAKLNAQWLGFGNQPNAVK